MMSDEQQNPQKLFSDFNPATAAAWEQKARKDLRDIPLDKLTWHTYEGIDVKPYYTREDIKNLQLVQQQPGSFPFMRGHKTGSNNWLNIQQLSAEGDGKTAINKAADALARGADGILFVVQQPQLFDVNYLPEKIDLSRHSISYALAQQPDVFLEKLYAGLQARQLPYPGLHGFVNYDPMTSNGVLTDEENNAIIRLLELTKDNPDFYGVTVCGTNFSSIGASITQEIAYTLSAAVAYTHRLTDAGEALEPVLQNMQFYMGSGTNYFLEIAKLRALRLLWAAITEAYQAEQDMAAYLRIHSVTSSWYQTTLDPYMNMLRVTTEAMSAVIAGCDALTVVPFDNTFEKPDEFSERIARNVSTILKEEAYLDKAIDPAAGSYYLESLTSELATKAWALFKEVEAKGGFEAAFKSGFILDSITKISRQKFKNIASGRDVLVGTNKYPNPKEKIDFDPEKLIQSAGFDTTRAAYPTEVMRMATELHLRKRKRRPKAVIAVIGDPEKHRLKTSFALEFFSCSGFDTEIQQYASAAAAADIVLHAAAEVVVVSSSEAAFLREFGPKLRHHLDKPIVILADDPQHMKAEMVEHGYNEFIFEGCDMSAIQKAVQQRLAS